MKRTQVIEDRAVVLRMHARHLVEIAEQIERSAGRIDRSTMNRLGRAVRRVEDAKRLLST